ncbi:hypothetical protein C0W50_20410 [Photobacterium leiognathi subsp. mandapamensis]|nr:hypothetical protein C0W50_20410 [Photobacterium leiognathi subsp. mandapamensis]
MNDWNYVNFSEDHEMNYHLGLVSKSQSNDNRRYLRDNTQHKAKQSLGKKVITHNEFKPFVIADQRFLD